MSSAKRVGRVVGLALLVQVILAIPVYFLWLRPATGPDFLAYAAGSALQIRAALLISFVCGAMTFTAAVVAMPLFRRYSERMAFAFLALSIVGLTTLAMESLGIRNMLSLSLEVAAAGTAGEMLQTLGRMARLAWVGAHLTNVMVAHGTVLLLYVILFRFALVPRGVAAVGMATSLMSTTVMVLPLLGYPFLGMLVLPAALTNLALTVWLIARGFEERQQLQRINVQETPLQTSIA